MNLTPEQNATYLSNITSIFFLGSFIGTIYSSKVMKGNIVRWQTILLVLNILSYFLFMTGNYPLKLIARLLQGIFGLAIYPCSVWLIPTVAVGVNDKSLWSMLAQFFFTLSVLIFNGLSLFDDGGKTYWKLMNIFPMLVGVLCIFLINWVGLGVHYCGYLLEVEGVEKTRI